MSRKKSAPLPDLVCLTCGDAWGGSAPVKYHAYILEQWKKEHGEHLSTRVMSRAKTHQCMICGKKCAGPLRLKAHLAKHDRIARGAKPRWKLTDQRT